LPYHAAAGFHKADSFQVISAADTPLSIGVISGGIDSDQVFASEEIKLDRWEF
jgi:hypothetical protein